MYLALLIWYFYTHTHTYKNLQHNYEQMFFIFPVLPTCAPMQNSRPSATLAMLSKFRIQDSKNKDKFQTAEVLFQFYGYLRCRRIVNLRVLYSGKLEKARLSASQILRGPSWRMTDHGHMQAFEKPSLVLRCRNGNVRSSIAKESLVSLLVVE